MVNKPIISNIPTQLIFLGIYPEPFFIWRNDTAVLATDFTTFESTLVVDGLKRWPVFMDFDIVDYQVYFINSPHICRANFDGSGKKIVA